MIGALAVMIVPTPDDARPVDPDIDRVARHLAADPDAFEEIYRAHVDAVYRRLTRILGPISEREDLTQDVFVALHRALHQFRGEAALGTWIQRIAINIAYDHLRRQSHRPAATVDDSVFDELCSPAASVESRAEAREELARVFACLARIKPKKRIALLLRLVDGLSFEEIGGAGRRVAGRGRQAGPAWPARARRADAEGVMTRVPDVLRAAMTTDDRLDDLTRARMWSRLDKRLHETESAPRTSMRRWIPALLLAAGVLCVAIVAIGIQRGHGASQAFVAPEHTTLSAALGPYTHAALVGPAELEVVGEPAEATTVRLDRGTLLAEFTGGGHRSLHILAPGMTVEIVGTLFAVEVREHGSCVSVSHGRVRVTHRGPRARGRRWRAAV